ncbi:MAG: hypothetical protein J5842_08210 [Lachnospiraceae bacterium]|nr:hypothetical protein [Lachnospiraceae bacterium]
MEKEMEKQTLQKNNAGKGEGRFSVMKRAPLLFLIPAAGIIITIAGLFGSKGVYASYDEYMHDQPPVALVMSGAADEVYPWSDTASQNDRYPAVDMAASADTQETGSSEDDISKGGALDDSGTEDEKMDKSTADGAAEKAAPLINSGKSTEMAMGFREGKAGEKTTDEEVEKTAAPLIDPGKKAETAKGSSASEDDKNDAKDEDGAQNDKEGADMEAEKTTLDDAGGSDDNESGAADDAAEALSDEAAIYTVPPESTCEVCGAIDYGISDKRYMSPDGWEAVPDTEGMFAPCGVYRPLTQVDEDYFNDALYIGDSRVEGLCDYGDLEDRAYFAYKNSMTIYKLFDEPLRYHGPDGTRGELGLDQILTIGSYGKIYLQIGINETGVGNTKTFYEQYRNVLGRIRARQPRALIYIDGIMHVTAARSSYDPVFTNVNIVDKNKAISTLANGRNIFYLDMNPYVCDENGNLLPELSLDHAHLKAAAHDKWREFLLSHAALPEEAR